MEFILTIDTEADNQWDPGVKISSENIRYIPRFHELALKYNITPTYLVTSEICEDGFAKEIFSSHIKNNEAEIGAHLHPWTTPPYFDKDGYRYNDIYHMYLTEMEESILKEKIKNLTRQIEDVFSIKPTSFRAGRFGINNLCFDILSGEGYLVDSSITPNVSWEKTKGLPNGNGGPNYIKMNANHFQIKCGNTNLWEIPVTVLPTKYPFTENKKYIELLSKYQDILSVKLINKIIFGEQPLWLRPYKRTHIRDIEKLIIQAKNNNLEYLVMMFHSSELMPGGSPYRKNQKEVDELFAFLECFFIFINQNEISSIKLSKAANKLNGENENSNVY